MRAPDVLCLDLGGTGLKGAIVRGGSILKRTSVETDVSDGIRGIKNTFLRLLALFSEEEYEAIALSSAGEIDGMNRKVVYATDLLPEYTGFDLGKFFSERTHKPFACLNDGQAALCGECFARNLTEGTVAMLTLGTGVGGGVIENGRPVNGGRLLSLGHLTLEEGGKLCTCGKRGCLEEYASGSALTKLLRGRGVACSKRELWRRYESGDEAVCSAVEEWLGYLRRACDLVYERYPYRLMILGGGVSDDGKSWFKDFKKSDRYEVELSVLGNDAGLIGAYSFYCGAR